MLSTNFDTQNIISVARPDTEIFALVDCNNFYVSCERVFNPSLNKRPVVVLSNNDGCIVSRSEEAKKIGIPMGSPLFKVNHLIEQYKVAVLSSNYSLYADMSRRVTDVISSLFAEFEIYSIDECFLRLTDFKIDNLNKYVKQTVAIIKKNTGIPVSIGVGSTKTLAKLANRIAKKNKNLKGFFNFSESQNIDDLLVNIKTEEIWGIGFKTSGQLQKINIVNALHLKNAKPDRIKRKFNVNIMRTVFELNGISCIALDDLNEQKKNIVSSRSFGRPVKTYRELSEAVSLYTSIAGEKLRAQKSAANAVGVFIRTNHFAEKGEKYSNSSIIALDSPTAYTPDLIKTALANLKRIFKSGYDYKKAGVFLLDLKSDDFIQQNLFDADIFYNSKKRALMDAVDRLNSKFQNTVIEPASSLINKKNNWLMKRGKKSPAYTSNWNELPVVKI